MCGICGIVGARGEIPVRKMVRTLAHRGPDDSGIWNKGLVTFGHCRLAVIDTSGAGHQPMANPDNSVCLTYNGEIYNFETLKNDLEEKGYVFRGRSDSEVILNLYLEYGKECLKHMRGMFSFAIWDDRKKELFAARDRLGIKPFLFYHDGGTFVFSSELRALLASGSVEKEIDMVSVRSYIKYGSVSAPGTMIKGIRQLMPSSWLSLKGGKLTTRNYWDPSIRRSDPPELTEEEHIRQVSDLLRESVNIHTVSDVPIGVFLSGGLDSSIITALAHNNSKNPLTALSVVFEEGSYDESAYSGMITEKFGVEHRKVLLRGEDIYSKLPKIFDSMDQPGMDGFNTYIISEAAKNCGLKVALSGLGGDELFAGYSFFKDIGMVLNFLNITKRLPEKIKKKLLNNLGHALTSRKWLKILYSLTEGKHLDDIYHIKRSVFMEHEVDRITGADLLNGNADFSNPDKNKLHDQIQELSLLELNNYVRDTLLPDSDRMSMANSLEVRFPYLDHRLVEKILQIPGKMKTGGSYPKELLVRASGITFPEQFSRRPKKGFVLPFDIWIKGPLKDYFGDVLETSKKTGFLDAVSVRVIWESFIKGSKKYNSSCVLTLVSLIRWHEKLKEAR